jgi:hypothetical protein
MLLFSDFISTLILFVSLNPQNPLTVKYQKMKTKPCLMIRTVLMVSSLLATDVQSLPHFMIVHDPMLAQLQLPLLLLPKLGRSALHTVVLVVVAAVVTNHDNHHLVLTEVEV